MPIQIALAWNDETEKELREKGFRKREVYVKDFYAPNCANSDEMCEKGNSDFFRMNRPPYQFITTSWWGAGND
jgi:hypothetical protein